jgi:hypothetical protein
MILGRTFVHPVFDYLVIGGGLSLPVALFVITYGVSVGGPALLGAPAGMLAALVFVSNNAHFAASSLRLYTRPDAVRHWPVLTLGLPLVALGVASAAIALPEPAGFALWILFQVWVPYHYSAQAYGLSAMYAYRSGSELGDGERRLLRWACLMPFVWSLLQLKGPTGQILGHFGYADLPLAGPLREGTSTVLAATALVLPVAAFFYLARRRGLRLPAISLLIVATNAIWWVMLMPIDAFFWATVFHGLQYLAIVTVFHVKERMRDAAPEGATARGPVFHAVVFYAANVAIGYALFELWPHLYALAGLNLQKSVLLVAAVINVHHFVVDAYIWKLRRDPNYRTVVEHASVAPVAPASVPVSVA